MNVSCSTIQLIPAAPLGNLQILPKLSEVEGKPFNLNIEIQGNFSIYREPEIFLKFVDFPEDIPFKGTIDTGSYYSYVKEAIPNAIRPKIKRLERSTHPQSGQFESPFFDLRFKFQGEEEIMTI